MTTNPLLGSWHLQRWEITYDTEARVSLPFGANATGLIIYSSDGWMSACVTAAERSSLSSDSVRSAPQAERLAAFESYFHYAGRYRLQQGTGGLQVVHDVTYALNPNFVGTRQIRDVHLDGPDTLTLSASDRVPGSSDARHHRLAWRRASL